MLLRRRAVLLRRHCGIVLAFAFGLLALVFAFFVIRDLVFMLLMRFHTLRVSQGLWKQCSVMIFEDRKDAGKQLAAKLLRYASDETRILALPRGGVPVAFEVALELRAPLDVFVVRKLGAPGREELAIGAIASGGVRVLNDETIAVLRIDEATIEAIASRTGRITSTRSGLPR